MNHPILKNPTFIIGIIAGLFALIYSSLFVVMQTQQALILQFGHPVRMIETPGLKAKIPFIQDARIFDKRILSLDPPQQQVILKGEKRLDVDAYARFQIKDPLRFYQSVGDEAGARSRLSQIVNGSIRDVLVEQTLSDMLSNKRSEIMAEILTKVRQSTDDFGIDMIDVRIRRADYPKQVSGAIYDRMKSSWEREAKRFRAEGEQDAKGIQALADKDRIVTLSEASKLAETKKGEGDAQASKIFSDAFGRDPQFYNLYRALEAYKKTLKQENDTTFILTPDGEFFKFFKNTP